jgi:predicted permease
MDRLLQDLRYAVRSFAKAPGFTALALLTIAIGIGINTTVFSFVNALLLRHTPAVADPGALVSVFTSDFSSGPYGSSSYPDYVSIKSEATAFRGLAAFVQGPLATMRVGSNLERVRTMNVSGEFFDLLGLRPAAGRLIAASDTAGPAPVAVISHALWQRAFGGGPSVVGAEITIDGAVMTIVGVAPERFDGLNLGTLIEIWTPLARRDNPTERGSRSFSIIGRLNRGSSLQQAQAQLDGIAARLAQAYPDSNLGTLARPDAPRPMVVVSHSRLHPRFRPEAAMIGAILSAAVGLVLLVACANVAGLLLSRATARAREIAVRLALGASRGRILRQMLTESVVLGCAGGGIGLLFALWTADVLPSFLPAEQARMLDAGVDWTVITFTIAVALTSGLIFGLAPAFQGLRSLSTGALRNDSGRGGDSHRTIGARNLLVVAQVALASVLLVAAVLLARSVANATEADLGFSTRNAVLMSVELPSAMQASRGLAYYDALQSAVAAIPGVEKAALARSVPVAAGARQLFSVPGYVPVPGEDMELHINTVHRDYFATMGIVPADGRVFDSSDAPGAPRVVVNDVLANRYYGGQAVGRRIRADDTELEIIGVVRINRRNGVQEEAVPVVFVQLGLDFMSRAFLVAKITGPPRLLMDTIRRQALSLDESVAVFRVITLEDHLAEAIAANRLIVSLVLTCGTLAFLLAVVGVYGIVAFAVARRTREIGVRVALGATPGQVLGLLLREGGRVIVAGAVVGVVVAFASTRLLQTLLYGISATDASTFLLVPAAVAAAAVVASCVPAARALRISPVAALRHE